MSIFDPHGYYISRKYNTAKGQILQKKPIDPPYVYDIASNVSKLRSLGYTVYKPLDNSIDPSIFKSYFITYPRTIEQATTTQLQIIISFEDIISLFRQNYDFSYFNQYDINSIKSIEFRLYSDCFNIHYFDNSASNPSLNLTTSTIDNQSITSYGIPYESTPNHHVFYIQNNSDQYFIPSNPGQIQYLNKSVESQFLAGGVIVYQSLADINDFISAITGQITFPGYYISLSYNDTSSSLSYLDIYSFPVRMDILIHFKV